jgi:hypothetical protein
VNKKGSYNCLRNNKGSGRETKLGIALAAILTNPAFTPSIRDRRVAAMVQSSTWTTIEISEIGGRQDWGEDEEESILCNVTDSYVVQ